MFEKIKWLFFDVGSTLVDEHFAYEQILQKIAQQAGIPYETVLGTAMEFYRNNKKGDLETAKLYGVKLGKWPSEKEVLYKEAETCLKVLSDKYKIGIIANQEFGTKERLDKYGVLQYIHLIIASAEEGVSKPDKKIFEIALERGACSPDEAVMIGDRVDNDIIPAKRIGMHTIWIRQGFGKYWNISSDMEKADYVVENLLELIDIL